MLHYVEYIITQDETDPERIGEKVTAMLGETEYEILKKEDKQDLICILSHHTDEDA